MIRQIVFSEFGAVGIGADCGGIDADCGGEGSDGNLEATAL